MVRDLKNYFVEFLGTFFLCFTVLCCIFLNVNPAVIPLAIGLVLAVLVYAGGPVSGAHYNPSVSLAIFLIGKSDFKKTLLYCIFQILGAACSSLVFWELIASIAEAPVKTDFSAIPLVAAEIIFTTLLIYTVIFTAVSKRVEGNNYFGFAIGTSVAVGVAAVGGICLAALNPAVAIAVSLLGVATLKVFLLTVAANIVASFVACGLYKLLNIDEEEKV